MANKPIATSDEPGDVSPMSMSEVQVSVKRDPEKIARMMGERLDAAETLDDLFNATSGNTSDELIGKTIEVLGVEWDAYEADSGVIPLAIVTARNVATNEPMEFASTAAMLTRFIRAAEVKGWIPFTARIEGKKTRSGQTALNFVRP